MKEKAILALLALGGYIFYFRYRPEKCNCPKVEPSSCPSGPNYVPQVKTDLSVKDTTIVAQPYYDTPRDNPKEIAVLTDPILVDTTVYNGPGKFLKPGPPDFIYFVQGNEYFKYNTVDSGPAAAIKITKAEMITAYNSL